MKRMKKLTSISLVLAMTVGLLAGCSGGGNGSGGSADASGGKGRYVEENWGNPFSSGDDDHSYVQSVAQLSDGTLRAVISDSSDKGFSIKDSTDGGKTWTDSSMDLSALNQLKISSNTDDDGNGTYGYLGNISIDADGDIAFVYTSTTSSTKDNVSISDSTESYYLLTKDGKLSEIKAEIPGVKKTQHYEYDMSEDSAYGSAAVSDEAVAEMLADGVIGSEE